MHKLLSSFALIAALAAPAAAKAETINGFFSAFGNDTFTSSSISFVPGTSSVQPGIGGTFANYLTQGNPLNFLPGSLPYTAGGTQVAPPGLPAFFTTSQNGETFSFFLNSYDAMYIPSGTGAIGCASGHTCLLITGTGFLTGTGVVNYEQTAATFQFDTSYVPGQNIGSVTTFAAQGSATGASPIPEPASLVLLGTGLVGVVGVARRKLSF